MMTDKHFWLYLAQLLLVWGTFQRKLVEKIRTHILCSMTFLKSCRLWDNVKKYSRTGQATDEDMMHVHCMMDT